MHIFQHSILKNLIGGPKKILKCSSLCFTLHSKIDGERALLNKHLWPRNQCVWVWKYFHIKFSNARLTKKLPIPAIPAVDKEKPLNYSNSWESVTQIHRKCDPNLYPNPNACMVFLGIKVRPEFLVELDPIHNVTSFEYLPLVRSLLLNIGFC